jgi:ParB family chromosome partitioning protein
MKLLSVDIKRIHSNKNENFNDSEIIALADSINKLGIISPITVRIYKKKDEKQLISSDIVKKMTEDHEYEVIIGEKRLRAMKILGKESIPCIISDANDVECIFMKLIDSQSKKNINMFEIASLIEKLTNDHKMKQDDIASRLSTSQSNIANKLRLLKFSDEEKEYLLSSEMSERHARTLLRIKDEALRRKILIKVCKEKLSVKDTEILVEEITESSSLAERGRKNIERLYKDAVETVNVYFNEKSNSSVEKYESDKEIKIIIRICKEDMDCFT